MMDFLFIAGLVMFFALTVGLVAFCEKLLAKGGRR